MMHWITSHNRIQNYPGYLGCN